MIFIPTPEIEAIIELIFERKEDPLLIDGTAPLEEVVGDPHSFIQKATERFGFQVVNADLKLTIAQFAERVTKCGKRL
jgi:hypothetical protein